MNVMMLGLDGATWDLLDPLIDRGAMPNLAAMRRGGCAGTLRSVFPPLSPVAWTTIMTGKNPGRHGVFEFLEYAHNPLKGRVNTSQSIDSELVWETAARHGKRAVVGAVPMSWPPRPCDGLAFLGDFLAPARASDFSNDPALLADLQRYLGQPYRPWNTAVHDGGREAETIAELTVFLEHHLKTIEFLMNARPWNLFLYNLMAVDRFQHELWHVWDRTHHCARGREAELARLEPAFVDFWRRLDEGLGRILARKPNETMVLLVSDHGFGPIEWFVNFNVWLLDQGFIALRSDWYVRQKAWFYRRGVTPSWFYNLMVKAGTARQRVGRFQGKQRNWLDRLGESMFLSRHHLDWSRTKAYAQGNFGQIFLNLKGRQPQGRVDPAEAPELIAELKEKLAALRHPETCEPLVARVYERSELYHGPHEHLAPDLTVVPGDWRCRTIGLHDFVTRKVVAPSFGPTGDHRMEGILVAEGPGVCPGSRLDTQADLADLAPTMLALLGIPLPDDLDGKPLIELLEPTLAASIQHQTARKRDTNPFPPYPSDADAEDEAVVKQRLADLGYL